MSTLLLRLAGPMQAWGTQCRFGVRTTEAEPTKSGVIGLVCAALGRPRHDAVDDLAALRMGVRVDDPGTILVDYQTAGGGAGPDGRAGVVKADGKGGDPVLSRRYYLADASFLVGLEGNRGLLVTIEAALKAPRWTLSLGRKAFVPGEPIALRAGLSDADLDTALRDHEWPSGRMDGEPLLLWLEDPAGPSFRLDQPVGAAFLDRTFMPRGVRSSLIDPRLPEVG